MKLNFKKSGSGDPLLILHGLFGSLDNWATLAKKLAEKYTVYLIDQRNHGHSPHADEFNYEVMSDDLSELIKNESLNKVNIIGHSMGGKTAMLYATLNPDKVNKLIVVDIAPKEYPVTHDDIIKALQSVDLKNITERNEADAQLQKKIDDESTRQFLLKSLYRKNNSESKFAWKFNLEAISNHIENVGEALPQNAIFDGDTLFINGANSDYITKKDYDLIHYHFPNSKIVTIKNAGHWVHAEQPEELFKTVTEFIDS